MKYARKNALTKPSWQYRWDPELRRSVRIPDDEVKPYRSYSKWHIAHDKSQYFLGGRVVSLCGTLNIASQEAEVSEEKPKRGKRGYGSSNICANCAMVQKALDL